MPKTREQKQQIVSDIADKFRGMKSAAFSSISGYNMAQADNMRKKASESGVEVFVAKKTLLGIAAEEAGLEGIDPRQFSGSILTAVAQDEVSAAKLLNELSKENEDIKFVAGVLEGKGIDAQEVAQLALLPGKEELLAKLVGSLNSPVSGFVNVLAGNVRGLVTVLSAIKDQK